jgi:hypothetical protein
MWVMMLDLYPCYQRFKPGPVGSGESGEGAVREDFSLPKPQGRWGEKGFSESDEGYKTLMRLAEMGRPSYV